MKLKNIVLLVYFLLFGAEILALMILYKSLLDEFPEMDSFMYMFVLAFFLTIYIAFIIPHMIIIFFKKRKR